MSTAPLLKVDNLKMHFPLPHSMFSKKRNFIRAVDGVSFELGREETLGLVGESGCGKSTTARAIAQLYKATEGSVYFNGHELTSLDSKQLNKVRKEMQVVFQDPYASLDPRLSAMEIIGEPLQIYRNAGILRLSASEIRQKVLALMDRVGLAREFKNRYPHEFSGGQRQRIGIARALSLDPKLILCDEAVSALDVSIQAQILNLFKDIQREMGISYLFIAHDLAVIEYISHRVAVMYLGVIVEIAQSSVLYKEPLHPYTQALLSAAPIPDPVVERTRKRIILEGDLPSPSVVHEGCYFYERCHKKMDRCRSEKPVLKAVKEGQSVACFLY